MSHVAFMYKIVHQKIIHDISSELLFQIMDSRCKTISTKMNIKQKVQADPCYKKLLKFLQGFDNIFPSFFMNEISI